MNSKVKVAWIAPYPVRLLEPQLRLARSVGGYHPCSWIVNLSAALVARNDVELHLITQNHLVRRDQVFSRDGIVFHVLKRGIPFTNRGFPRFFPLDVLTWFAFERHRIQKKLQQIQPDLVHAHGTEGANALAAAESGFPCLISIQGIIAELFKTDPTFRFRVVRHSELRAVRKAAYFTCRTNFDTGFVRTVNPHAKIFHIHEAMHPVYFENQWQLRDENTLLYVGSLENRKGLPLLLKAMRQIVQKKPTVILTVIGGGSVTPHQQHCATIGITNNVQFVGFQPPDVIARYHCASQIFVLPSENENSPNTLAEAMVSGLPVIATAVGGIPSMIQDGETGILVPPRSPQELAEAIIQLLETPRLRQQLGDQARSVARPRHWPATVAEQTAAAYKEILNSTSKHT